MPIVETADQTTLKLPPVIILGMHRSGTSMLTRMLERLGLFVGCNLGPGHHESGFFNQLNDWILRTAGGRWDFPASVHYLQDNPTIQLLMSDYLRLSLRSPRAVSFFGWQRWLRYRQSGALDQPWGWKDPRNTFTLPLWLDLFPDAKVVHIYRHGVDVARSLQAAWAPRAEQIDQVWARYTHRKFLYQLHPMRSGFTFFLRAATLEGCFSLWEEYMQQARFHIETLGERGLEIKYEDFLQDPAPTLRYLAHFCGLNVSEADAEDAARLGRIDRAYAFRRDSRLYAFAEKVADRLMVYGYGTGEQDTMIARPLH